MSYLDCVSVLGIPSLSLPILAQDGLPMGVQMMGFYRRDAELVARARWVAATVLGG